MDKRTIIFLLGITFIFYFWNQWNNSDPRVPEVGTSTPNIPIEIVSKGRPAAPLKQSDFANMNLVRLYADIELSTFVSYAYQAGDNFLFLAENLNPPKVLFVETVGEKVAATNRLSLRIKPKSIGMPTLYSVYPLSKINVPYIPDEGTYPVVVVYNENGKYYSIKGMINERKALTLEQRPPVNGMIFLNYQGILSPFAIYEAKKNAFDYLTALPLFDDYVVLELPENTQTKKEFTQQKYYVLENEYQQVVFTNLNGAIAEINLPFRSEINKQSIVRPIEFDEILETNYPRNSAFPLFPYYVPGSTDQLRPVVGGYTPFLRRTIIGASGAPSTKINANHYACTVFEHNKPTDNQIYSIKRFEKDLIEFELTMNERKVTKTYRLPENPNESPYIIDFAIDIQGDSRGFYLGFGVPEVELVSGSYVPNLQYTVEKGHKMTVEKIKTPKGVTTFSTLYPNWVGNGNGFFGIISMPLNDPGPGFAMQGVSGEIAPTRLTLIDPEYQRFSAAKYPGYLMTMPIHSRPGVTKYRLFAGPYDKHLMQRIDRTYTNPDTGRSPYYVLALDYSGFFAFLSQPFSKFLFILLNFFHTLTSSWGFSIILLTIALRFMLFPLHSWSMKSQLKLQAIQPKIKALEEKYKKDDQKKKMEMVKLYQKEKVNPFGGCLPLLIQLPFLLGMFNLLKSSFALRGASFIPGWINNLTAPDVIFTWKYPLPFFGNAFHLLPFFLGLTMFLQGKISAPKTDGPLTDQQRQQKMILNVTTVVFTVLFYNFPSGLCIYWISSSVLGMLQTWWLKKRQNPVKA